MDLYFRILYPLVIGEQQMIIEHPGENLKGEKRMERKVKIPRRVFTVYIGLKCLLTGLNHESLHVVAHLSQALKIPRIVEIIADFVESVL